MAGRKATVPLGFSFLTPCGDRQGEAEKWFFERFSTNLPEAPAREVMILPSLSSPHDLIAETSPHPTWGNSPTFRGSNKKRRNILLGHESACFSVTCKQRQSLRIRLAQEL